MSDAGVHHMDEQKVNVVVPLNIERLFRAWAEIRKEANKNDSCGGVGLSRLCGVVSCERPPGYCGGVER